MRMGTTSELQWTNALRYARLMRALPRRSTLLSTLAISRHFSICQRQIDDLTAPKPLRRVMDNKTTDKLMA